MGGICSLLLCCSHVQGLETEPEFPPPSHHELFCLNVRPYLARRISESEPRRGVYLSQWGTDTSTPNGSTILPVEGSNAIKAATFVSMIVTPCTPTVKGTNTLKPFHFMKVDMSPCVFVSHDPADREFVEQELIPSLKSKGINAWHSTGSRDDESEKKRFANSDLEGADWILVVISKHVSDSGWVRKEVKWAADRRHARVVAALIDDDETFRKNFTLSTQSVEAATLPSNAVKPETRLLPRIVIAICRAIGLEVTVTDTKELEGASMTTMLEKIRAPIIEIKRDQREIGWQQLVCLFSTYPVPPPRNYNLLDPDEPQPLWWWG